MDINWNIIIEVVGVSGVVTGGAAWLIKKLGTHYFDRGLKKYELELNQKADNYRLELNKQLEAHKLGLDKQLETHKAELNILHAKQDKLQIKRLEVMSELYKRIVNLDMRMQEMTAFMKQVFKDAEEEENERVKNAGDAYNDFFLYYMEHKIFFSKDVSEALADLRDKYYSSYMDYTFKYRFGINNFEINRENFDKASETVKELIPPIKEKIEAEFRNLAGVEE